MVISPVGAMLLALVGCGPEALVNVRGDVFASPEPLSAGLPGAVVRFVDYEGEQLGKATADGEGAFQADLPASTSLFVEITAEGYGTTTFAGEIGIDDVQQVEHRALFGFSLDVIGSWRARFAGCPGADDPDRAMVLGEIRAYGLTDTLTGGNPTVAVAEASVAVRGDVTDACYLDEQGAGWDPDAQYTGAAGMFAVFDVPVGVQDLRVNADLTGDDRIAVYPVWVPESPNVVSAWFPAYVELF